MSLVNSSIAQTDPSRLPRETLLIMHDLLNEHPNEPGLPDEQSNWILTSTERADRLVDRLRELGISPDKI